MGGLTGHVLELYGGDAPQFLDATRRTGRVRKPVGMPITEASRVPWGGSRAGNGAAMRCAPTVHSGSTSSATRSPRPACLRRPCTRIGPPASGMVVRAWRRALKALRCGDTLVVWKLDRLGRDLAHLVGVVSGLAERKIGLRVLTGQGAAIDTGTASGRLVFGIFAALAEVRARTHSRANTRRSGGGQSQGAKGWTQLRPDQGPGPPCDGRDEGPRCFGHGPGRGTRDQAGHPVPIRQPERGAT